MKLRDPMTPDEATNVAAPSPVYTAPVGYEAAALEGLATNGPAQAYALGYQAGRIEAFAQQAATAMESAASELEAIATGGYGPEQQARADAIAAASRCFQASLSTTEGEDDLLYVTQSVQEIARSFAHYIEHGDQPKTCAPIPCPPFEETFLAVDPVAFDRHVDEALNLARSDPDLGDRLDQELAAAKMAQPRARPTQT